jgi:ribosome-binding factor A
MPSRRIARLNEQVKREIMALLWEEVRDPRIGTPTLTAVEISPDLSHAKVFYTAPGDEAERAETLAGLRAAAPFLRTELGRRLHVRRIPELHFQEDRTLDHAMRIERLLREVLPADGAGTGAETEREPETEPGSVDDES